MNRKKYFENKIILITGGSSGIGYALAEKLIEYQPKAIVLLSHTKDKLASAVDKLKKYKSSVEINYLVADIADSQMVESACHTMLEKYGAPAILINNAGYAHYHLFHEMTEEEVVRHVNVNLIGAMRVVHAFLPQMRARKSGQIVNVASIAGHMVLTPNLAYTAAKHGMVAWSEGLGLELHKDNILVQVVSPGRVETDFFNHETFQARIAGAETRLVVSMPTVVNATINAIVKHKKITIVPGYWRLVAWTICACPFIVKRLYFSLLRKRIARIN